MTLFWGVPASLMAITPSGEWVLKNESKESKDYFMRIDVDPGEFYLDSKYAQSSVFWAEYIAFNKANGGYLGLQRVNGHKIAIISIWDGIDARSGHLPVVNCYEFGECSSLKGDYEWKVGHAYRFRVEISPNTPSDYEGDWWQITLVDLTLGKIDILGEIKTPKWGGLHRRNGVFLEYFSGPYTCSALRHSKTTEWQVRGNYGQSYQLEYSSGDSYGTADLCSGDNILPDMSISDYGSSSSIKNGTITLVGNNYRGIQQWGMFKGEAKKGMMFVSNINDSHPYIFQAKNNGKYGGLPERGFDNLDWKSIGIGYPIINDLYHRNQKLYNWEERNNKEVNVGDFFIYSNSYSGDIEYFKLLKKGAGYFPIDKTDNSYWQYYGRYAKDTETSPPPLHVHNWDDKNRNGKKGWLYFDYKTKLYFILKNDGLYWYFPIKPEDNQWWKFLGYHP